MLLLTVIEIVMSGIKNLRLLYGV